MFPPWENKFSLMVREQFTCNTSFLDQKLARQKKLDFMLAKMVRITITVQQRKSIQHIFIKCVNVKTHVKNRSSLYKIIYLTESVFSMAVVWVICTVFCKTKYTYN